MQFSTALLAAVAVAVAQAAQFTNTPSDFVGVTAGSTFTLTWDDASGPVTLYLKNGDPTDLQTVSTIASGLTGSSYAFSIPSTLPAGYYAFEIDDSTGPNYSVDFDITGGPTASSSVASSTAGSSSTVASSVSSVSSSVLTSTSIITSSASSSTVSAASNSTSSGSTTKTSSSIVSKTSSTSTSTATASVNSAAGVASPLAFVFLALAAIMTIN